MSLQTFSSSTPVAASRQTVWDVMTDHPLYADWSQAAKVTLETQGSPPPNGTGAVRVFHTGPVKVREEVTAFEPPDRMAYRLVSGPLPVRNYRAEMVLEGEGDSCTLHWDSWFETVIPLTGRSLRRLMASAVAKFAAGIAEEAERRTRAS